jgi:hypothetical protein
MSIDAAIAKLQAEIAARTVRKTFSGSAGLEVKGGENEY